MRQGSAETLERGLATHSERVADGLPGRPSGPRRNDKFYKPLLRAPREFVSLLNQRDISALPRRLARSFHESGQLGQRRSTALHVISHVSDVTRELCACQDCVYTHTYVAKA